VLPRQYGTTAAPQSELNTARAHTSIVASIQLRKPFTRKPYGYLPFGTFIRAIYRLLKVIFIADVRSTYKKKEYCINWHTTPPKRSELSFLGPIWTGVTPYRKGGVINQKGQTTPKSSRLSPESGYLGPY
jgi:hypothetical protein